MSIIDYSGDMIDGMKIIKKIGTKISSKGRRINKYLVQCPCGEFYESMTSSFNRGFKLRCKRCKAIGGVK